MTLLLMGEFVEAPSSNAVEDCILPFAETVPMLELEPVLFPVCVVPDVPGIRLINDCQSGVPVCGSNCRDSDGKVAEISGVVVSSNGALSSTIRGLVDSPAVS